MLFDCMIMVHFLPKLHLNSTEAERSSGNVSIRGVPLMRAAVFSSASKRGRSQESEKWGSTRHFIRLSLSFSYGKPAPRSPPNHPLSAGYQTTRPNKPGEPQNDRNETTAPTTTTTDKSSQFIIRLLSISSFPQPGVIIFCGTHRSHAYYTLVHGCLCP